MNEQLELNLSAIAAEINLLHGELLELGKLSVEKAMRIGELLIKAKGNMKHGTWMRWFKERMQFSMQTGDNYRNLYKHRDKFPNFRNLSLSDAYALLMDKQRKRSERRAREKKHKTDREEQTSQAPLVADEYRLIHADLREASIDEASIDAIVTDPPYASEFLECFSWLAEGALKCLRPGGSALIMSGNAYVPDILQRLSSALGFNYQWTLCYRLPGPNQAVHGRRVYTGWKPVFWFVKGRYKGSYFGDTPTSQFEEDRCHKWGQTVSGLTGLVERISEPGQTVLDPFCGGGSTGVACYSLNRKFIGVDSDEDAINETAERLSEEKKNANLQIISGNNSERADEPPRQFLQQTAP